MNVDVAGALAAGQDRHAVAGWLGRLSLRARLSLLVALIVTLVGGTAAFLELRMFTSALESELIGAARITALAVADDFELRVQADGEGIAGDALHQFLDVNTAVQAITVIEVEQGTATVVGSTSSDVRRNSIDVAERAIAAGDEVDEVAGPLRFVGVPFRGPRGPMGVVVTVSTDVVDRVARSSGLIALWVMLPAILVATVLLDWFARRLIHRRIGGIRATMQEAAAGTLSARAVVERQDEIGAIAAGLNAMLTEMQELSESLQTRVRDATSELRTRNAEVEEMYQRVFDLREALGKAEQLAAVGQAAANVAHQVGTPLNLVSGYVQVMLADGSFDTRTRRRLEMMQRQVEQVAGAVRGLLDRARRTAQKERVDPGALLERVLEIAQPRLERSQVDVDVQAPPDLPRIDADVVQLELALLNLVTNAIDAMEDGGTLAVTLVRAEDGVRLDVGDTGPGIPESLLPKVFEPWVTTKPFGRGTGLGLAIARGVIAAHGGTISVKNRSSAGAVFSVTLPASTGPAPGSRRLRT